MNRVEEIKDLTDRLTAELSDRDLIVMKGTITLIQRRRFARENRISVDDVFVCPMTGHIRRKKSGKKIIMERKMTRYSLSTSWVYLSRMAYNKIMNPIKG